jgi:hypothetical protein
MKRTCLMLIIVPARLTGVGVSRAPPNAVPYRSSINVGGPSLTATKQPDIG